MSKPKNKTNDVARKPRRPCRAERVKLLAAQYDTITEAEAAAGLRNLAAGIDRYPDLRAAWERGSLLRHLGRLAEVGTPLDEAQKYLEQVLPAETDAEGNRRPVPLAALLATDAEARDIWNKAPLTMVRAVRDARVRAAKDGDAKAATAILSELRDAGVRKKCDYRALTMREFSDLLGVSAQTGYNWKRDGMPCNADGTVELGRFLKWFETKIRAEEAGREAAAEPGDRLREIRAAKMAMEMDKERGQLVEREKVLATLAARARQLAQVLERTIDPLTRAVHGHTLEQIRRRIEEAFAGIRAELARPMKQPPGLPDEAQALWEKLMGMIQ